MKKVLIDLYNSDNDASVQIPNSIFKDILSYSEEHGDKVSFNDLSFMYSYTVLSSIMYKYCAFVNLDSRYYIQNGDMKEILGYSRKTKSVDRLIRGGGLLDRMGVSKTTSNFPISFNVIEETINDIPIREYSTINYMEGETRDIVWDIVKNKNYTVKKVKFITGQYKNREFPTLYNYENTHKITIKELISFFNSDEPSVTRFSVYSFIKSMSFTNKYINIAQSIYKSNLKISPQTLYIKINELKELNYLNVKHVGWQEQGGVALKSNKYKLRKIK